MRNIQIERVPEGIRIRRIVRSVEARASDERARVARRIREVASTVRTSLDAAFTDFDLAWFRRPLL